MLCLHILFRMSVSYRARPFWEPTLRPLPLHDTRGPQPRTRSHRQFQYVCLIAKTDNIRRNAVDKAILARNIISLHCRYASLGEIDEKTLSSIQSNYNIYLKENVSQYIELKNKVAEFICDVITKIGDYTIAQLSGLKNNLIAIFGFLLTVMLANIVSEQPLENIFTKDITIILELVLAGSFVYLVICYGETRYKLNKAIKSYQLLKNNYSVLLSDEDMREAFNNDRQIEQSTKTAFCGIRLLTIFWLVILIIFLVVLENISNNPIISPWLSTLIHYVNTK